MTALFEGILIGLAIAAILAALALISFALSLWHRS